MGFSKLCAALAVASVALCGFSAAASADQFDNFKNSDSLKTVLAATSNLHWVGKGPKIDKADVTYSLEFTYAGKDQLKLVENFAFATADGKKVQAIITSDFALHLFSRAKVDEQDADGYLSGDQGFHVGLFCKTEARCFTQKMTAFEVKADGTLRPIMEDSRDWETVDSRYDSMQTAQAVAYALSDLAEIVKYVKD